MAATAKTFTGATAETIIAADVNRDYIVLQLYSSDNPVYLAFGATAVASTGVSLIFPGDTVKVKGPKARLAISGIDAGSNAVIGIETMQEIEYVSGQFAGPWPAS
jgi:hypothetical protein